MTANVKPVRDQQNQGSLRFYKISLEFKPKFREARTKGFFVAVMFVKRWKITKKDISCGQTICFRLVFM